MENRKPVTFENVKVCVGNPWNEPLQGKIRGLVIIKSTEGIGK